MRPGSDGPSLPQSRLDQLSLYLHTTEVAQPTSDPRESRQEIKREAIDAQIAEQVTEAFADIEGFREAAREGRLATELIETFGAVTGIHAHEVYINDPQFNRDGKLEDGTVTAKRTTFTVEHPNDLTKLHTALQVLLRTCDGKLHFPVLLDPIELSHNQISVGSLNEHTVRSLARALQAVEAQEYAADGVKLPSNKDSLEKWKEQGHTVRPSIEKKLQERDGAYQDLQPTATYLLYPKMSEISAPDKRAHISGREATPVTAVLRDIFNPLIRNLRGDGHHNPPQDPEKGRRMFRRELKTETRSVECRR